jgi:hypothetical protein
VCCLVTRIAQERLPQTSGYAGRATIKARATPLAVNSYFGAIERKPAHNMLGMISRFAAP